VQLHATSRSAQDRRADVGDAPWVSGVETQLRLVARQAITGLLLGSLTWAYTLSALLLAGYVVIPASGCDELSCLGWFLLAGLTVPVVVAALAIVLPFRRPGWTYVLFVGAVGGLLGGGTLAEAGALPDLLILAGPGALAAGIAGAWPTRSRVLRSQDCDRHREVVAADSDARQGNWSLRRWSTHLGRRDKRRDSP
jgi:hypothetical protein